MKKINIFFLFGILLLILIPLCNSEMTLWNNVIVDRTNNVVKDHAFYVFQDTIDPQNAQLSDLSSSGSVINKPIDINLNYDIVALPYDLSPYNNSIQSCNLTVKHYFNTYDASGNFINASIDVQSYYFANTSQSSGTIHLQAIKQDSVTADISCQYENSNNLYVENFLAGRLTTIMPSYQCDTCTSYTLEQQSDSFKNADNVSSSQYQIYNNIQSVVSFNYKIWLILSWIIKIAFIFIALTLLFTVFYYFYNYIKSLLK